MDNNNTKLIELLPCLTINDINPKLKEYALEKTII